MKKGFTIIEVSILFVIFLIVAFLVAPLSLDDTMQARNTSRWRSVQADFVNIYYSVISQFEEGGNFNEAFRVIMENEIKSEVRPYKISLMNGSFVNENYRFSNFYSTYSNAVFAYKLFDKPRDNAVGILMYDVNGSKGPNVWGKDVFGLNIYANMFEPLGKNIALKEQKQDCSRSGTGLYCSNYYLIGGSFD